VRRVALRRRDPDLLGKRFTPNRQFSGCRTMYRRDTATSASPILRPSRRKTMQTKWVPKDSRFGKKTFGEWHQRRVKSEILHGGSPLDFRSGLLQNEDRLIFEIFRFPDTAILATGARTPPGSGGDCRHQPRSLLIAFKTMGLVSRVTPQWPRTD